MKKTILAGAIAAMMLASAATSAVTFARRTIMQKSLQ